MVSKFYALDDSIIISSEQPEGSIEITEQQYSAALSAKYSGRRAFVRDGELVIFSGTMIKAWDKTTKQLKEFDEHDVIPDTHTTIAPIGDVEWSDSEWVERVKSAEELALIEHAWVISELDKIQVELMYHWTDDKRASHTLDAWKQYARDLRNYTTTDERGFPSMVGSERPELTVDEK